MKNPRLGPPKFSLFLPSYKKLRRFNSVCSRRLATATFGISTASFDYNIDVGTVIIE